MRVRNSHVCACRGVLATGLLGSILLVTCIGTLLGFVSGLIPGLHMNNIAAALTAYASAVMGLLSVLGDMMSVAEAGLLASCLVAAAMTAHSFAESITSAYVGIPAGDVVSVLPAHRLARAGLGKVAVRAAADGTMFGLLASIALLLPVCLALGPPLNLYSLLRGVMGYVLVLFAGMLVISEVLPSLRIKREAADSFWTLAKSVTVFALAGVMGCIVFLSDYDACRVPDFPWLDGGFVPRSSLLLPMFAGLFGVPGLLLSLGSRTVTDLADTEAGRYRHRPGLRDTLLLLSGGVLVGWIPGMTSGSAVAVCAPSLRDSPATHDVEGSARFVWLYSAISSSGAALSLGALFVIMRARSGSMDAIDFFLRTEGMGGDGGDWTLPICALLLSMILASAMSLTLLRRLSVRITGIEHSLFSARVTMVSLLFVCLLSVGLTGVRGGLLMATCACLGLIPPLAGVRRIQLMGCLLVPVSISLLGIA